MSDTPPHALPTAQDATIVADIPCFFCQYNLRTLSIEGTCPECGHAVGECIRTGWLMFSDPRWLAKLRTGVTIILWLLFSVILSYVGFIAYVTLRGMSAAPSGPPDFVVIQIVSLVLGIGVASAWIAAVWYLTSPELIAQAVLRRSVLCVWIRILNAVIFLAAVIVFFSFAVFPPNDPMSPIPTWGLLGIVVLITSIAGQGAFAVGLVLLVVHMRRIARREIKKGLARLMTFLLWGGVALSVGFGGSLLVLGLYARTAFIATATSAPVTMASTPQASSDGSAPGYTTSEYVLSWGNVSVNQPGVATTSAPAATTGPAAAPAAPLVALGYVTTAAAATTMPAGAAPMPFGRGFMIFAFAMCGSQLLAFGWFISGVVALFWFRGVFKRAIRQQTGPPSIVAP